MDTMHRTESPPASLSWRGLGSIAGLAVVALLAVAAAGLRDLEAAALTLGGIVALGLLRWRTGLLGVAALGLLSANVAFWMAPGAVSNMSHGEGLWETALPSLLTVAALTTVAAAIGDLVARVRPSNGGTGAKALGIAGIVAAIAALAGSALMAADRGERAQPGDLEIIAEAVKFAPDSLASDAGEVAVFVSNKDLFWHTFTIKELDVDLNVPVGGERRIAFDAPAGTYRFVCAIPGHTQAGMEGRLVVS
jgi:plastocyanin